MASAVATRRHVLLLGFLTIAEANAHFLQLPVTPAEKVPVGDLWRRSRDERGRLDGFVNGESTSLSPELDAAVEEVRGREAFDVYYASQAEYEFANVPMVSLLTPQASADMEYVGELAAVLTPEVDTVRDFQFAFPSGALAEPMLTGPSVLFSSYGMNMTANAIPTVEPRADGTYNIIVHATRRPNYVQVVRYGGRLVVVNGVHKVLALASRGRRDVACLVRNADRREDLGINLNLSMHADAAYLGARPPLVRDFLGPVAVPVNWRSTYSVLRVVVQVDQFAVPAVPVPSR